MSSPAQGGWTGTRLRPLPHESTLSALWRFGWQNGLSGGAFFEICCGTRGFVHKPKSLMIGVSGAFVDRTNWSLPDQSEKECLHFAANTPGTWIHRNLRFCPICLEAGYHSIWFQFSLLHSCPLHDCALTDQCQSCGDQTGYYGATPQFTFKPYGCLNCGEVLSGVVPGLTTHLELRSHRQQLERAFAGLLRWVQESKEKLLPLQYISRKKRWLAVDKAIQWCNPEALLHGAALELFPFSGGNAIHVDSSVSLLCWQISMQTKDLNPGYARRSWRQRVQTPTAVYRATIRKLQRWLFGESTALQRELELRSRWIRAIEEDELEITDWNLYELAYVLLRNSQSAFIDFGLEVTEIALKSTPSLGFTTYEDRAPRIAYRAGFLAVFAGYFYWMMRARRSGQKLKLSNVTSTPPSDLIAIFGVPQKFPSVVHGGVFFPTVPGLPLAPLNSIRHPSASA